MNKKIGIFSLGRKLSRRCPNKMLRPFSGTTLTDIVLKKLATFGENSFFAGYEGEFKEKCEDIGVRFVQRTKESVSIDEPQIKYLSFLRKVNYDYLLIVNGCLPLLKVKTIMGFLNEVVDNDLHPSSVFVKRSNYFFGKDKLPLNFSIDLKNLNTKSVSPVYEFSNALYFFNRKYFLDKKRYWDWEKLRLIELENSIELIDIDTEEDFLIAESVWENLYKEKNAYLAD